MSQKSMGKMDGKYAGNRIGRKKLKNQKESAGTHWLNPALIYDMISGAEVEIWRMHKEIVKFEENHLEKTEAEKIFREKLESSEKILVGIGSEWKKKDGAEEENILAAAEKLSGMLKGRDFYVITSLSDEDAGRLPFDAGHMAVPRGVSFTEESWKAYTLWLSCTLNRNTLLLELGENFKDPSLIRWPFEKTAMLNNKAYLFRVHKNFSQIPEELAQKACPLAESSVTFIADL